MKKAIVLLSLLPGLALAWGPTGHRAVGAVAEKHLTTEVKQKLVKILRGQSLSKASNWPDEIKSDPQTYQHTFNWHYTDWKDEDQKHDEGPSSGKLVGVIREQLAVLKDVKASFEKKEFAVKFLVHLVGDLHQPLHVGNGNDRGGNFCKVTFHNQDTNLHALWDEGMIDFTKLSFTELADFASQGRTREEIAQTKKGDLVDWAKESKELRASVYPPEPQKYCKKDGTVPLADVPKLAYEYSYKFVPVLEKRIFQAGVRLAQLLNGNLR